MQRRRRNNPCVSVIDARLSDTPSERRVLLAFLLILCYTYSVMRYSYIACYEKNAARFRGRPRLLKALPFVGHGLTVLFFVLYALFLANAVALEYPPEELIKIIGAPALCLFLVSFLRLCIYRPRPYSEAGANIQPLYMKKGSNEHSFPSRHTACAFVIACTLFPYSIGAGICSLLLAGVLAYVRFTLGVHYPSDLIGGALLGIACGVII